MKAPNVIKRAQAAWGVFRRGYPRTPRMWPSKKAEVPLIWPDWRTEQPQWHIVDFESYVNEGFNLNTLVYSAIMYKVRAMTSAPLRAYSDDKTHLDSEQPLSILVDRPNPYQSFITFHGLNIVYLNISGNCYILIDREEGVPKALYTLRPDRVFIVPKKGSKEILGYLHVPEGKQPKEGTPIPPQDIMHIKLPNPSDPLEGLGYGLSPISSAARSISVDNAVTHFLKLFFDKGAVIPGILRFDVPLSPSVVQRIKERWKELYSGYEQWTDIGVLDRGAEYERIGLSFDEMGFAVLDERNESRILGPFGVPPILIGSRLGLLRSTYANYQEARRHFWIDTMVPETKLFEKEYAHYLKSPGAQAKFDFSSVAELMKDIPALTEAAYHMWQMGVPANQAFDTVGLDLRTEGGDVSYLPMEVSPADGGLPVKKVPPWSPDQVP